MKNCILRAAGLAIAAIGVTFPGVCQAQNVPSPVPAASPTPAPHRITWSLDGSNTFISQHTGGPGIDPPEGNGFAAGSPLSPMTPYDAFSSAPYTPGQAGALQYVATAALGVKSLTAAVTLGAGLVQGSTTNLAYWSENLLPGYNPHIGSTALPYSITFPDGLRQDDGHAQRLSLLGASLAASGGNAVLRGGYFNLSQTARFVFAQPQLTNVTPAVGVSTAESLGDGPPSLAWWPPAEPGLPLLGADFTARRGAETLELSDGLLPALAGTAVRLLNGSLFIDRGGGTRYAFQVIHVATSGAPIATTTMFGADAHTVPGPQGELPVSTLGNQRQSIAGVSAAFHLTPGIDAQIDLARSWYDADYVREPGTQKPGGYYHLLLSGTVRRATASAEFFRFEPRYATAILPYGAPENVWSIAWSWPGQWLKSTYQLVDNTALGANRQGVRFRYRLDPQGRPFALRASYAIYRQIDPTTLANVSQTGFVDGFFLPQQDDAATKGGAQQYALWASLQRPFATITLDYVNDLQYRPATLEHPEDYVNYVSPQAILTFSRQISPAALVAIGAGRYAMRGVWATTPVDYGQNVVFAGAELQESKQAALLVHLRATHFDGLPASPLLMRSPDFGSTLLVLEQRFHF